MAEFSERAAAAVVLCTLISGTLSVALRYRRPAQPYLTMFSKQRAGARGVGKIGNKYEFRSGSDPYAVKVCSGVTSARTSRFERLQS